MCKGPCYGGQPTRLGAAGHTCEASGVAAGGEDHLDAADVLLGEVGEREALASHGLVSPCRIAFRNADALGLGVTEFEPRGPAASELRSLWAWLHDQPEDSSWDART